MRLIKASLATIVIALTFSFAEARVPVTMETIATVLDTTAGRNLATKLLGPGAVSMTAAERATAVIGKLKENPALAQTFNERVARANDLFTTNRASLEDAAEQALAYTEKNGKIEFTEASAARSANLQKALNKAFTAKMDKKPAAANDNNPIAKALLKRIETDTQIDTAAARDLMEMAPQAAQRAGISSIFGAESANCVKGFKTPSVNRYIDLMATGAKAMIDARSGDDVLLVGAQAIADRYLRTSPRDITEEIANDNVCTLMGGQCKLGAKELATKACGLKKVAHR